MAHYIFNTVGAREQIVASLRAGRWRVGADEPLRDALAPGDLVLLYLGAPDRVFLGRARLGSAVDEWTPSEAGVQLVDVEEWDPPVLMSAVLAQIDSPEAKADFDVGVVLITEGEYATAVAVAHARRGPS